MDALDQLLGTRPSLELVREFHQVFGHPVKEKPDLSDATLTSLRVRLIQEELDELGEAIQQNAPVEALDALLDLQYVLDGAFLALGFHRYKDEGMREVHASNMSKLDANGKPIRRDDGKILKGPNFKEPDLTKVLASL